MSRNPYFNFYKHRGEQNLHEDLIVESIKIFGIETVYLPKNFNNKDIVFGEDPILSFSDSYEIEQYLENWEGFSNDAADIISKFNLQITDEGVLIMSQLRFYQETNREINRPTIGDLIYVPLNNSLFEIKFVENEDMFYVHGSLPVFKLSIKKYEYSHEVFDTTVQGIQDIISEELNRTLINFTSITPSFIFGEHVYQGVDYATSNFKGMIENIDGNSIEVSIIQGSIDESQDINGVISNAVGVIDNVDDDIIGEPLEVNKEVETRGNSFIDFSEDNPFGTPDE